MTRTEYLTQLELYLKKLPQADQIEAMDYFRELFDDAGVEGEEELIASLGTPKEAAHEVLSNLLDKKINEAPAQKNNRQILHIALLALLAAPIGIPLGIAILVALFGILVAALTVILAFFAISILGIIGGFLFLVESFTILAQAKSAFILIFGSGLLAIGASSLVLLGISYVARSHWFDFDIILRSLEDFDNIWCCEFTVFDTTSFNSEEIAIIGIDGRIFKTSISDTGLTAIC